MLAGFVASRLARDLLNIQQMGQILETIRKGETRI